MTKKAECDILFRKPSGYTDLIVCYYQPGDTFDFLIQFYDCLIAIWQHQINKDTQKGYGKYILKTDGLKKLFEGKEIETFQHVGEKITHDGMIRSLINSAVSDIVHRIYLLEKGDESGSEENRRDDEAGRGTEREEPDGVSGSTGAEEGCSSGTGSEGE